MAVHIACSNFLLLASVCLDRLSYLHVLVEISKSCGYNSGFFLALSN